MTVKQATEYFQMYKHTAYNLASYGQIPSIKITCQCKIKKELSDKWISKGSFAERVV